MSGKGTNDYMAGLLASGRPEDPAQTPRTGLIDFFSAARPEARGLYYRGQTIALDGYRFVGCRFDHCNLQVSTTNFELINCIIDPTTAISYSAPNRKIIRLFSSRYPWAPQHFAPGFVPTQNPDGSITISDHEA